MMLSIVLCTIKKEHLKSFEIKVGHSPSFGHPSVAILSYDCAESDVRKEIIIVTPANHDGAGNNLIDPYAVLAMPFNFILSSNLSFVLSKYPVFVMGNAT